MSSKGNVDLAKEIIEAFRAVQPPIINSTLGSILLINPNSKKHIKAVRDLIDIKNTTAFQKELRAREIVRLHDEEKLTYEQIGALFNDVFDKRYTSDKYYNTCISPSTIGAIYRKTKKKESKK